MNIYPTQKLRELQGVIASGGITRFSDSETIRDAADALERLGRVVEAKQYEAARARAQVENAVALLTGIHALLYPAPITTPDGRTLVFRPKNPDPHEVLQELSDRIRELPDKLANILGGA